ncbi:MAG: hypothetical protein IJ934_01315 [Acetobacter sp.]|nr:hypothetical protein [Acetobacter sp.]
MCQLLNALCLAQSHHFRSNEFLDFVSFLRRFMTKLNGIFTSKIKVPVRFEDEINDLLRCFNASTNYTFSEVMTRQRLVKRRLSDLYNSL